jgi:hypothetical protein
VKNKIGVSAVVRCLLEGGEENLIGLIALNREMVGQADCPEQL